MRKVLIVYALLVSACALTSVKQTAVVTLAASEQALEASHDLERTLCNPAADKTQAILTCNGTSITTEIHQRIAPLFSKAFATETLAALALKKWKSGDPVPTTLADYQKDVLAIVAAITELLPQARDLLQKTQSAATEAQKTTAAMGAKS